MQKKLVISEVGKEGIERIILVINIGLLTLLEKKIISIEEAENYLYSPYSAEHLRSLKINNKIVDLIIAGCEFEDFESLMPDKLIDIIKEEKNKSINIFKSISKPVLPSKKWIDTYEAT